MHSYVEWRDDPSFSQVVVSISRVVVGPILN
jgi:hypothetical protein